MKGLWLFCLLTLAVWAAPPKDFSVVALAWSDDSQTLLSGTAHGELILWNASAQRLQPITRHLSTIRGMGWKKGEWITFSSDGTVRHSAKLDPLTNAGYLAQAVRGGARFAIHGFKGLQIFDMASERVIARVEMILDETPKYTIDPQGAYLSVQEEHHCVLIDAATGEVVKRIELVKPVVGQAFSPSGTLLVNAGAILEYSVPKGELLREYPGANWHGFRVRSDDRALLLWQGQKATFYTDRDELTKTVNLPAPASEFASEGRLVIFKDGKVHVVTEKNVPYLDFNMPGQYSGVYQISPDGKRLALGMKDGSVRIFSLQK